MSALNKQDVLIIDDDESIRNLLRHALLRLGMRCGTAADGLDAAHRIHEIEYAVLLLDVTMPRVDGFGFLEYLREWEGTSGIRTIVILMTAAPDRDELTTVGDMVQVVVPKPFDLHELADLCHDCVVGRREYDLAHSAA